jgi:hypothetical protein
LLSQHPKMQGNIFNIQNGLYNKNSNAWKCTAMCIETDVGKY